jgi:hypothetical protein
MTKGGGGGGARDRTFGSSSVSGRDGDPFAQLGDELLVDPLAESLNVGGVDQEFAGSRK